MFGINDENNVFSVYTPPPDSKIIKALPAGVYNYVPPMSSPVGASPPMFRLAEFHHEDVIKLRGGIYDILDDYLNNFLSDGGKLHYKDMGFLWKTGILLYGKPGTGKTMLTYQLMDMMVEKYNTIVIHNTVPEYISGMIELVRKDDPDRLIMIVSEEVDGLMYGHSERILLEFLDGSQSVPGVIFLGTTNFIQDIPDRIRNRPSRLNLVLEVPELNEEQRAQILDVKIPSKMKHVVGIGDLAKATEGMSLDHVKASLLYMTVHKKSLDESVNLVKGLGVKAANYSYGKKAGFKAKYKSC